MTSELQAAAAQIAAQEEMVTVQQRAPSVDMSALANSDKLPAIAEQLWSALASCVHGIEQTIDAEEYFKDELEESREALNAYEDYQEGDKRKSVKSSLENTLQSALDSATQTNKVLVKRLAKTMQELAEVRAENARLIAPMGVYAKGGKDVE